jgi:nitrite reductase (NO-forming)
MRMGFLAVLIAATFAFVVPGPTGAQAQQRQGDPQAGARVFQKCQACHTLEAGKHKVGPSLADIIGRTAGTQPNFNYSVAMRRAQVSWDRERLDKFLRSPWEVLHGTKMVFTGLKSDQDRADVIAYLATAGRTTAQAAQPAARPGQPSAATRAPTPPPPGPTADPTLPAGYTANVRYAIRSGIAEGRMVFIGVGGDIDGVVNPKLSAHEGDVVQITLINGEGAEHDIVFEGHQAASQHVVAKGASTTLAFRARAAGDYTYFCSLPGHRDAGMSGTFSVGPSAARPPAMAEAADISLAPTEVPPPIKRRTPERIKVELESVELEGRLADGATYTYWTFNRTVPGPFIRARVGDTIDVTMKNDHDATMIHSVDFHAATGPGGGAVHTQVGPGESRRIEFKALAPGLYVYHCATPMVPHHIANGMYGLILIEPEDGLPPVDHEFYVMQGEIYTEAKFGTPGMQEFSVEKLLREQPEYFVFNGSVGALTAAHPMSAKVGETVRLYVGSGGPNFTSSFHVIGEIFDKVYAWGDLVTPAARAIQTVSVPPGGAVVVEFKVDYPGRYLLVDHALSRLERGLVGFINVEGPADDSIYKAHSQPTRPSGH